MSTSTAGDGVSPERRRRRHWRRWVFLLVLLALVGSWVGWRLSIYGLHAGQFTAACDAYSVPALFASTPATVQIYGDASNGEQVGIAVYLTQHQWGLCSGSPQLPVSQYGGVNTLGPERTGSLGEPLQEAAYDLGFDTEAFCLSSSSPDCLTTSSENIWFLIHLSQLVKTVSATGVYGRIPVTRLRDGFDLLLVGHSFSSGPWTFPTGHLDRTIGHVVGFSQRGTVVARIPLIVCVDESVGASTDCPHRRLGNRRVRPL